MNENVMNKNTMQEDLPTAPMTTNDVELVQDTTSGIMGITIQEMMNPKASHMLCTMKNDGTVESKAKIYNSINSPDKKLSECIGETINLKDVICHTVQLIDENTGEVFDTVRSILIDDKGVSYQAVSTGVNNSLSKIFQIFGSPENWEKPLPIKAKQKQTNNGNNKVTIIEVVTK